MSETQAPFPESSTTADTGDGSIFTVERITQAMVIATVVVFWIVFRFGVKIAAWPREPGFEGSLAQPPGLWALIVAVFLLVICTAIGTMWLGRRWFLAGLMTATAGLATWSIRGGRTTYVLLHADSAGLRGGVFVLMLIELIALFGVIAGLWMLIWTRNKTEIASLPEKGHAQPTPLAIAIQAALMMALVLIFVYTSQKKQVLAGVFLAGLFSTAIAEHFFASRKAGQWYWLGPLLAGAVGYILCAINPAGIEIGDLSSIFAPMARVLPLDYASVGCAGALLGYWWMSAGEDEEGEKAGA